RPEDAALMLRVVGRLEKLGESLLDFARARPSVAAPAELRPVVEEAVTLVRLDRELQDVSLVNDAPEGLALECDSDRILQVLVNLIRNAADAIAESDRPGGEVRITAAPLTREGADWVSVAIEDTGPGIDPEMISTLFEPFTSTRLDSRGA